MQTLFFLYVYIIIVDGRPKLGDKIKHTYKQTNKQNTIKDTTV